MYYKTMMIYQSRYDEQGVNVTVWDHTDNCQRSYANVSQSTQVRLTQLTYIFGSRLSITGDGLTVFLNNG